MPDLPVRLTKAESVWGGSQDSWVGQAQGAVRRGAA